jgi:tetratricopeptide (TPR) repeat protein
VSESRPRDLSGKPPEDFSVAVATAVGFVFALGFALFNVRHGYHPTDDGFMLGLSWRIVHGEVPYRDFIFVRPPLTPFLHTIWFLLPEGLEFQAARLGCSAWFGAIFLVPAAVLATKGGLRGWRVLLVFAVAGIGWLVSVNNFPPMPWYTLDGVFFSTLAFTALYLAFADERKGERWLLLGALLAGLAPWAKHNFAVVPAAYGFVALLAFRPRLPRVLLALALPSLVWVAYLGTHGALGEFKRQITAVSTFRDAINAGVLSFIPSGAKAWAILVAALAAGVASRKRSVPVWVNGLAILAFLAFLAKGLGGFQLATQEAGQAWTRSCFLVVALYLGARYGVGIRGPRSRWANGYWAFSLGALVTAWASAISWASPNPTFGMAPVLLAAAYSLCVPELGRAWKTVTALAALAVFSFGFGRMIELNVERPYREAPRSLQTRNLGELFPKLGPKMTTSQENFDRFKALQDTVKALEAIDPARPIAVMPEFGLFHYLSGRRNPAAIDWWLSVETAHLTDRLKQGLLEKRPWVIVEMKRADGSCSDPFYDAADTMYGDQVAPWVVSIGTVVEVHGAFCAFEIQEPPPSPYAKETSRAIALTRAGMNREALEAYQAALRLEPGSAVAHNNVCTGFNRIGDWLRAAEECRRALAIDPSLDIARNNLGVAERALNGSPPAP